MIGSEFWTRRDGNVAIIFALMSPVLLGVVGAGIDFQRWHAQRADLQDVADTLAIRGARELLLANTSETQIENLIRATAANSENFSVGDLSVDADAGAGTVLVTIREPALPALILSRVSPYKDDIIVEATAVARGGGNICVIALEETDERALSASMNSRLSAEECVVYSNSLSTSGVYASGSSLLEAAMICSGGGKSGAAANFDPGVVLDCPPFDDPLAARTAPTIGACDYHDLELGERTLESTAAAVLASFGELRSSTGGSTGSESSVERTPYTLMPGVYCGGISVAANADVTLEPGIYVIKDGELRIGLQSRLTGDGVGFYLSGADSVFTFGPDSKIELSAPKSGLLAGILVFEDRNAPLNRTHSILSDDARRLLGTFYLSRGNLFVSTLLPVADQSAYTAIVARKLTLFGNPTLVLNTDYQLTDVPVPDGVGPVGGQVQLRR